MDLFRSAAAAASIHFRRWLKDRRVWLVFLIMGIYVYSNIIPFTSYALDTGQKCSVYLLPVLFQSGTISVDLKKVILHAGMLVLLCDAPFFSAVTPYVVLRSRRNGWWAGECLYILLAAFVYALFLGGLSMLLLAPVGIFGNEWGGVIKDLIHGKDGISGIDIALANGFQIIIPANVGRFLYPQGAQLYTFFAIWFSFTCLGLLMYLVSLASRKVVAGMAVSGVVIFADPFLCWFTMVNPQKWVEILSPVCWTSIDRMQSADRMNFMSIPLAMILYVGLIVLLTVLISLVSKRAMIETGGK